jgi:hypothetical protein
MRAVKAVIAPTTCSGFSFATALRNFNPAELLLLSGVMVFGSPHFSSFDRGQAVRKEV